MPTLPARAAAYTRTNVLRRFLDQIAAAPPARVDNAFAEERLGLKGGDVRAFLQSARVLGLVDPYGALTERGRRARAMSQRGACVREGLAEAYPELVRQWEARGGMSRGEVEDFFKVEYGLSASSAGPAAKLFEDLAHEYGVAPAAVAAVVPAAPVEDAAAADRSGLPRALPEPRRELRTVSGGPTQAEVKLAALDAIKSSVRIDINADWDQDRIQLVFDRMERLVERILAADQAL